jgi:hypothetical protein
LANKGEGRKTTGEPTKANAGERANGEEPRANECEGECEGETMENEGSREAL